MSVGMNMNNVQAMNNFTLKKGKDQQDPQVENLFEMLLTKSKHVSPGLLQ